MAVDRVVPEQIGEVVGRSDVVDGHQFELRCLVNDLERRPSDAAKTVDGDAHCHSMLLSSQLSRFNRKNLRLFQRAEGQSERPNAPGSKTVRPSI